MALSTSLETLTENWTEVGAGATRFIAQVNSVAPVGIHVGAAMPGTDAPQIVLDCAGESSIALDQMDGEKIYARALRSSATLTVIRG